MVLKSLLAVAFGLALAGAAPPPPAQSSGGLELVDLTDDFARIYDRDATLSDAERVARFKAEFATRLPGFYDHERLETSAAKYDERVLKALNDYPKQRAEIDRVSREFGSLLAPAQRTFEAEFGPMTGYPPVYLVDSFGEFDGGTRSLPEGTRLLFGADVIAQLYKSTPIQPFFHHELFHLMHHRTFDECEQLWCALWTEGLAVYVASRLNPGAGDDALLLTFPAPIRPAVDARKAKAVCTVLQRLGSTAAKDYAPLFMGGGGPAPASGLPRRFGYYVGLLVAEDLGRTRSLQQLAALTNEEAKPLVEQSLRAMVSAPCPQSS